MTKKIEYLGKEKKLVCHRCRQIAVAFDEIESGAIDIKKAESVLRLLMGAGRYSLARRFIKKSPDKQFHRKLLRLYEKLLFSDDIDPDGFSCVDFGCCKDKIESCFSRESIDGYLTPEEGESCVQYRQDKKGKPLNRPFEMIRFTRSECSKIGLPIKWDKQAQMLYLDRGKFNVNLYLAYLLPAVKIVKAGAPPQLYVYSGGCYRLQQHGENCELQQLMRLHIDRIVPDMWRPELDSDCVKALYITCPDAKELKSAEPYICTANKLVYVRDGKLKAMPHSSEVFCVKQVPVEYDENAECPRFKQFLTEIADDDEQLVSLFQEMLGYVLCNSMKGEALFWNCGGGSNGKSILCKVIRELVGGDAGVSAVSLKDLSSDPFAAYDLINKFVLLSAENSARRGKAYDIEQLKKLASGDPTFVRGKYKQGVSCSLTAKAIFNLNEFPSFEEGATYAFMRRCFFIPFDVTFVAHPKKPGEKKRDVNLLDKLLEELPGILVFALNGYCRLVRNNFEFTLPERVKECQQRYIAETNIYQRYAEERLEPDEEGKLNMTALKNDFKRWAKDEGSKEYIGLSNNRFSTRINDAVEAAKLPYFERSANEHRMYMFGCRFRSGTNTDGIAGESALDDSRLGKKLKKTTKRAK